MCDAPRLAAPGGLLPGQNWQWLPPRTPAKMATAANAGQIENGIGGACCQECWTIFLTSGKWSNAPEIPECSGVKQSLTSELVSIA
jgi:hypothetical protein